MRLVFLGTGTSFGVPQIGCSCRTCASTDPRDKRTRTAALIETHKRLHGAGHELKLIGLKPRVRNVFAYAGLDRLLDIE